MIKAFVRCLRPEEPSGERRAQANLFSWLHGQFRLSQADWGDLIEM